MIKPNILPKNDGRTVVIGPCRLSNMENVYVNRYGAGIVKCCASCTHKVIDTRSRICDCGGGIVKPSDLCTDWQVQKGLENAGKGGGRIKKRAYLYTIHEKLPPATIKAIAADFEKMHGSIFEHI